MTHDSAPTNGTQNSGQGKKVNATSPWAKQLCKDIWSLEPFLEGWCSADFSHDSDLNAATKHFDFSLLRNESLSARIEWKDAKHLDPEHFEPETAPTGDFFCPIGECRKQYTSARALACHIRKCADLDHSLIQPLAALAISSDCPICRSRFYSKQTAVFHLQRSYVNGYCIVQRGPHLDLRIRPKHYRCPYNDIKLNTNDNTTCEFIGSTHDELQMHIVAAHIWWDPFMRKSIHSDGYRIAGTEYPELAAK